MSIGEVVCVLKILFYFLNAVLFLHILLVSITRHVTNPNDTLCAQHNAPPSPLPPLTRCEKTTHPYDGDETIRKRCARIRVGHILNGVGFEIVTRGIFSNIQMIKLVSFLALVTLSSGWPQC